MEQQIIRDGRLIAFAADEPGDGDRIAEGVLNALTPVEWGTGDERMVPVPPVLDCKYCDASHTDGIEKAKAYGWADIFFDPTGAGWNYLGMCPKCAAKESTE